MNSASGHDGQRGEGGQNNNDQRVIKTEMFTGDFYAPAAVPPTVKSEPGVPVTVTPNPNRCMIINLADDNEEDNTWAIHLADDLRVKQENAARNGEFSGGGSAQAAAPAAEIDGASLNGSISSGGSEGSYGASFGSAGGQRCWLPKKPAEPFAAHITVVESPAEFYVQKKPRDVEQLAGLRRKLADVGPSLTSVQKGELVKGSDYVCLKDNVWRRGQYVDTISGTFRFRCVDTGEQFLIDPQHAHNIKHLIDKTTRKCYKCCLKPSTASSQPNSSNSSYRPPQNVRDEAFKRFITANKDSLTAELFPLDRGRFPARIWVRQPGVNNRQEDLEFDMNSGKVVKKEVVEQCAMDSDEDSDDGDYCAMIDEDEGTVTRTVTNPNWVVDTNPSAGNLNSGGAQGNWRAEENRFESGGPSGTGQRNDASGRSGNERYGDSGYQSRRRSRSRSPPQGDARGGFESTPSWGGRGSNDAERDGSYFPERNRYDRRDPRGGGWAEPRSRGGWTDSRGRGGWTDSRGRGGDRSRFSSPSMNRDSQDWRSFDRGGGRGSWRNDYANRNYHRQDQQPNRSRDYENHRRNDSYRNERSFQDRQRPADGGTGWSVQSSSHSTTGGRVFPLNEADVPLANVYSQNVRPSDQKAICLFPQLHASHRSYDCWCRVCRDHCENFYSYKRAFDKANQEKLDIEKKLAEAERAKAANVENLRSELNAAISDLDMTELMYKSSCNVKSCGMCVLGNLYDALNAHNISREDILGFRKEKFYMGALEKFAASLEESEALEEYQSNPPHIGGYHSCHLEYRFELPATTLDDIQCSTPEHCKQQKQYCLNLAARKWLAHALKLYTATAFEESAKKEELKRQRAAHSSEDEN